MPMRGKYPYKIQRIPLAKVLFVSGYYPREEVHQDRVNFFMELYSDKDNNIPLPEMVWDNERKGYVIIDGHHRINALLNLNEVNTDARISDIPRKYWYAEAGLLNSMGPTQMTPSEYKHWICGMFERGLSEEIIARDYAKRSVRSIERIVKPLRDAQKAEREETVRNLRDKDGLVMREIAEQTGLSKSRVAQICASGPGSFCPVSDIVSETGQNASETLVPAINDHQPPAPDSGPGPAQPDPEMAAETEAEAKRNAEIRQFAHEIGIPQESADKATARAFGTDNPENSFPGLGINDSMPALVIDQSLLQDDLKKQIDNQFPTRLYKLDGYEECTEVDKKALRVLELVKFYEGQGVNIIETDIEKSPEFIFRVMSAAVICAVAPRTDDIFVSEVAELLTMPFDLVETIDDVIRLYTDMLHPVAPYMSDWIERNLPAKKITEMLSFLRVSKQKFCLLVTGTPIPEPTIIDFPKKDVEPLRQAVLAFREYGNQLLSTEYTERSLILPQRWAAKMQTELNKIYDFTKNFSPMGNTGGPDNVEDDYEVLAN